MGKRNREESAPVSIDDLTEQELEQMDDEQIQALLDQADNEETLDSAEVKRMLVQFEKRVVVNQQKRMKYPEQPEKFMDAEVDLHDSVKELHALAAAPDMHIEVIQNNSVPSLLGLVSHENTDISVEAVHLISELVDPETVLDAEDPQLLANALLENSLVELLVQNLERMDEAHEEDQTGVHHTLAVFENLVEIQPALVDSIIEKSKLMSWLISRLKERMVLQNRVYCSELIAIFLQHPANQKRFGEVKGAMDVLLEVLARYRRKDPASAEEQELVENTFDALCSALMVPMNQGLFVKGEGLELMLMMVKEKKFSRSRALKVLNFALKSSPPSCERFVSILGNKTLFPSLMRAASKSTEAERMQDEENVMSCISHLLQHTSGEALDRTVAKFCGDDSSKVDRLLELHLQYTSRVGAVDAEHTAAHLGDLAEDAEPGEVIYLAKLDAGLFTLQLVNLVWGLVLYHGRSAVKGHTSMLFHQHRLEPAALVQVLKGYLENIGDANQAEVQSIRTTTGKAIEGLKSLLQEEEDDSEPPTPPAHELVDEPPTPPAHELPDENNPSNDDE